MHRYGDRTALNGVTFDVRPAELFGLLGPNGSGKTTMFRILSTLMVPVGGRTFILGHDAVREPSQLRREIGVVFQSQSIDVKLTATENLRHQGHLYGLRGKRACCMALASCCWTSRRLVLTPGHGATFGNIFGFFATKSKLQCL